MVNIKKLFKFKNNWIARTHFNTKFQTQDNSLKYQKILSSVKYLLQNDAVKTEDVVLQILKQQKKMKTVQDNISYLQQKYRLDRDKALQILQTSNYLWTFLDKSRKGFLSQDFSINLLNNMRILLERNEELEIVVDKIFQSVLQNNMTVPENGIPEVDLENPYSLFERQLKLEQFSENISQSLDQSLKEQLIQNDISENVDFFKQIVEENLEPFLDLIINEQTKCYDQLQTKGAYFNLDYERTFLMLNPEQWAILSLNNIISCLVKYFISITKVDKEFSTNLKISSQDDHLYYLNTLAVASSIMRQTRVEFIYIEKYNQYVEKAMKHKNKFVGLKQFKEDFKKQNVKILPNFTLKNEVNNAVLKKIALQLLEFAKVTFRVPGSRQKNALEESTLIFQIMEIFQKKKLQEQKFLKLRPMFLKYLEKKLDSSSSQFLHLNRAFPQIHKPLKWQDLKYGGYYLNQTPFMKVYNNTLHERALECSDLTRVFKAVDYISETEWQIDKFLLQTIQQIWSQGGGKGKIPERYERNQSSTQNTFAFQHTENYKLDRETKLKHRQSYFNLLNNNSLKCDFLLKYESALSLKNVQKIYFPHNLDFRGRIYPVPPHLNHMGADLSRALLVFSQRKPLGKRGLRWLKIHCCNKIGYDKLKMDDREAYIDDNIDKLMKWVENPLKNEEWLQLENCWQSLGALNELKNALDSRFPEDYCSNIPVHQDGSCNGLQHYAALGRDRDGAFEVNLINRDQPGDVYTKVMQLVVQKIKNDRVEEQEPEKQEMMDKILHCIERKTIKQTVMTIVYGVTFLGAKDQILKQLKSKYPYESFEELSKVSIYITKLTLDSVGDLFTAASNIKEFFKQCARIVAKCNQPMSWITPMGLPVIQPYVKDDKFDVLTSSATELKLKQHMENSTINLSKQSTAFPPNYIHSLDSTHLMFTAERMQQNGLQFASVHDSFWTHACDVDKMNGFLREEFVNIYSMPLLEKLKHDLERRFPDQNFPEIPKKGNLDLNEVLNSQYFFS